MVISHSLKITFLTSIELRFWFIEEIKGSYHYKVISVITDYFRLNRYTHVHARKILYHFEINMLLLYIVLYSS